MFFHRYIYGALQTCDYTQFTPFMLPGRRFPPAGKVFASILVKDVGTKLTKGVDLSGHEVKSAENGGSYEYQYHKNTGKEKLLQDMRLGHLFFDHRDNLRQVDLRYASGEQLSIFFDKWLRDFPDPYPQRFRRGVSFSWVKTHGTLLMSLRDGEVEYPKITPVLTL
jgi:hypothetical protein